MNSPEQKRVVLYSLFFFLLDKRGREEGRRCGAYGGARAVCFCCCCFFQISDTLSNIACYYFKCIFVFLPFVCLHAFSYPFQ